MRSSHLPSGALFVLPALLLGLVTTGCRTTASRRWSVSAPSQETLRSTTTGQVVGGPGRYGSHAWLGIPFAAPPVGELRWRAPRPPAAWTGVRQALAFSPPCPQFASSITGNDARPGEITGSEDCLTLNVWTPPSPPGGVPQEKSRLPVMFWIHGGGNSIGSAAVFDGGHLATRHQVVVVSTQYRLGPLGWFRHRALRAGQEDPAEQSGNFATLDLIRALEWVRDNVAAFGGDPGNITVFGESAGGVNVFTLLLAPGAKGLFHRAIVQSGGLFRFTPDEAERYSDEQPAGHKHSSGEVLAKLLVRDGQAADRAAAKQRLAAMSDAEIEKYLRGKSPKELLEAYASQRAFGMLEAPFVFSDGAVLPAEDWLERLARPDGWNRVPVLVGSNRDEMKLFYFLDPKRTWKLLGVAPRYVDEPRYHASAEAVSRTWKLIGVDQPAAAMRRSGATEVHSYRFDWRDAPTVWGSDLARMLGAAHAFEIPFVFGHFDMGPMNVLFDEAGAQSREQLSSAMMSYWAEFAHTGAPGRGRSGDLPQWTAWDDSAPDRPKFMLLDVPAAGGLRMSAEVETRERIISDVDADPRLPAQKDKCTVLHDVFAWGRWRADGDEYVRAGRQGCAEYPFNEYPWGGVAK